MPHIGEEIRNPKPEIRNKFKYQNIKYINLYFGNLKNCNIISSLKNLSYPPEEDQPLAEKPSQPPLPSGRQAFLKGGEVHPPLKKGD